MLISELSIDFIKKVKVLFSKFEFSIFIVDETSTNVSIAEREVNSDDTIWIFESKDQIIPDSFWNFVWFIRTFEMSALINSSEI